MEKSLRQNNGIKLYNLGSDVYCVVEGLKAGVQFTNKVRADRYYNKLLNALKPEKPVEIPFLSEKDLTNGKVQCDWCWYIWKPRIQTDYCPACYTDNWRNVETLFSLSDYLPIDLDEVVVHYDDGRIEKMTKSKLEVLTTPSKPKKTTLKT